MGMCVGACEWVGECVNVSMDVLLCECVCVHGNELVCFCGGVGDGDKIRIHKYMLNLVF